jgi:hypothetical protein
MQTDSVFTQKICYVSWLSHVTNKIKRKYENGGREETMTTMDIKTISMFADMILKMHIVNRKHKP